MNNQVESAERGDTSVARLSVYGIEAELDRNARGSGLSGFFQRGIDQFAGHQWSWRRPQAADAKSNGASGRSDELMAVLSHELRNSLGAINNAAVMLRMEVSPAPSVARARLLIERQVAQMTRIVEDFHDLSGIRSGKLRLQRARLDLGVAVAQSVSTVEFATLRRNHRVVVSVPTAPVWLHADAARLEQIFVNLLINAAKYTDDGGEITVSVEASEHEAIVRIRDSGIGIAPEALPHVFELFMQADVSSRRVEGGVGIGLALVRGLVLSHGGHVTAQSAGLGKGSEFAVRLPLSREMS
jgi:signal transduction histidine kinase